MGGTGAEGFGLALRMAKAGHSVTIGSRDASRGAESAAKASELAGVAVEGTENAIAAGIPGGDGVVAVTVPYAGQAEIIARSRTSLPEPWCSTRPARWDRRRRPPRQVVRPWHGSAAEQAQAIFVDRPRVVAGFHTIAAGASGPRPPIDSDVFVCADDAEAKARVGALSSGSPACAGWTPAGSRPLASPKRSRHSWSR